MKVHWIRPRFISKIETDARNATIHAITELAGGMRWNIPYSTQPNLTAAYHQRRRGARRAERAVAGDGSRGISYSGVSQAKW